MAAAGRSETAGSVSRKRGRERGRLEIGSCWQEGAGQGGTLRALSPSTGQAHSLSRVLCLSLSLAGISWQKYGSLPSAYWEWRATRYNVDAMCVPVTLCLGTTHAARHSSLQVGHCAAVGPEAPWDRALLCALPAVLLSASLAALLGCRAFIQDCAVCSPVLKESCLFAPPAPCRRSHWPTGSPNLLQWSAWEARAPFLCSVGSCWSPPREQQLLRAGPGRLA